MFAPLQQLPRLDGEAIQRSLVRYRDHAFVWTDGERRGQAQWLRWGVEKAWITVEQVEEAFDSPTPWYSLGRCVQRVTSALGGHLNQVFANALQDADGGDNDAEHAVHIDYGYSDNIGEPPILSLSMGDPVWLSVGTLHTAHPEVAALVYATLDLISSTCLPCPLPHDLRGGYYSFFLEELFDELDELEKAIGPLRAEEVVAHYAQHDDSEGAYYFGYWAEDCESLLAAYHVSRSPRPSWMMVDTPSEQDNAKTWRRLQHCLRRVQGLTIEAGDSLWVEYATAALACLKPLVGTTPPYRHERDVTRDNDGHGIDMGWVVTSDPAEMAFVEGIFQNISETGEFPQETVVALDPDDGLLALLRALITGCGLLLRADRTNEAVRAADPATFAFEADHA